MPIFEYKCEKCGKSFEKLVPNASAKVRCDKCGSGDVKKQLSRFSASVPVSGGCPSASECPSAGGGCPHGGHCCCGGH